MEQQNVYNLINFNEAAFDQKNVPPIVGGPGSLYTGVGQCSAYSTVINAFSAHPRPRRHRSIITTRLERFRRWQCQPDPQSTDSDLGPDGLFRHAWLPCLPAAEPGLSHYIDDAAMQTGTSGTICDISTSNPTTGIVNTPIAAYSDRQHH